MSPRKSAWLKQSSPGRRGSRRAALNGRVVCKPQQRLYQRAFALPADEVVKTMIVERLLVIFDVELLNDSSEMTNAFRELITLKPTEVDPLFRYAQYQEQQGAIEGAEETLLASRRVQPNAIEPFKMLARFYARRASAMHAGGG